MITLSALLLAGGESRRMGRDKATIEIGRRPLWERQLEILRALEPNQIFVSARTAPPWLPADVELLIDDPPARGPLCGLAKALGQMRTTHLVALAVDMPIMTRDQLGDLRDLASEGSGIVPAIGGRTEPLAAIYPAEASGEFSAALRGSDFSLQLVVRKLAAAGKVRLWPVPERDSQFYQSWNQPGDLKL